MTFRKRIHNLIQIKAGPYIALVPYEYDQDLKNTIQAALFQRHAGLSSTDYTKKRYIDRCQPQQDPKYIEIQSLFDQILDYSHRQIQNIYDCFYKLNLSEDLVSIVAIESSLTRLTNSYESAFFLVRNQLFFESMAIIRLIFEQLNYCINICDLSNDEYISISKTKSKKILDSTNINKLKKMLPGSRIGNLYSYLSEITHIDIKQVNNFIRFNEEDKKYYYSLRDYRNTFKSAIYLLWIIDLHSFVYEYSLRKQIKKKFNFIIKSGSSFYINPDRAIKKQYLNFVKRIEDMKLDENHIEVTSLDLLSKDPFPEYNF